MKQSIVLFVVSIENSKTLKFIYFFKKTLYLSIICSECGNEDGKMFKEEEPIEILKVLGLIKDI